MSDFERELARASAEAMDPHRPVVVRGTPAAIASIRGFETVPVPSDGPVLFVLHLDELAVEPEEAAAMANDLQAQADALAPGRNRVAVLTSGLRLEVLTDEQLAPINLQHIPARPRVLEFGTDA